MAEQSRQGYLVLADISGYTSFLAKVELEHAHEILTDLLETIVTRFQSLLTISKLEGDAVFAYVEEGRVPRGETLLELIEGTYADFRQRRDSSNRATTCTCRACQHMPTLELKFFVHHGNFIVQHVAGIRELIGSDVNLIHRLSKNHITENTGWRAYSLFTRRAIESAQLTLEDVHAQVEEYEHLGEIETISINLLPRYDLLAAQRLHYISASDAHMEVSHIYRASEPELWQLVTSADILTAIMQNAATWSAVKRPGGRTGVGAVNHCAHGKSIMQLTIVDWHPFEYFTGRAVDGPIAFYQMYEIVPLPNEGGAKLIFRGKLDNARPRLINTIFASLMFKKGMQIFLKQIETYIESVRKPAFQLEGL